MSAAVELATEMRRFCAAGVPSALALVVLMLAGCGYLDEPPRASATSVRVPATALSARVESTPIVARPPSPTRTPTAQPAENTDVEQSVTDARATFEGVFRTAALPGIEDLLVDTVALAAPSGGEQLPRAAAARWLRQRAPGRIRITEFQRHQHQALIIAMTQGWAAVAPLTTSQLGLTLRRYDATGAQDPEHGDWLIDVFEAE